MTVHTAWENDPITDLEYEGYTNDARSMTDNPVAVEVMRDLLDRYPGAQDYPIFAPMVDER